MSVTARDIRDLLGEHEGIRANMRFLARSHQNLSVQDIQAKERFWAYRCGLHDFKDVIEFHIELDRRIFDALPEDISLEETDEEHGEIQILISELIELADNAVVDKFDLQELSEYSEKIGLAINKIFDLVEIHITIENRILEKALDRISAAI